MHLSSNPFPKQPPQRSYEDLKNLSASWDIQLGYRINQVEQSMESETYQGEEVWIGFDPQTVNTPYTEIQRILEDLRLAPEKTLVDLGAGYGRFGVVIHYYWPGVRFLGFEIAPERAREANRIFSEIGAENCIVEVQNLADPSFHLPEAAAFVIYDYSHAQSVEKTLQDLRRLGKPFQLVARGGRVRSRIEKFHPWLAEVTKPLHRERYSIFYSDPFAKP